MTIIENKKIRHEYHILESFEAGIKLQGSEVKSLRAKKVNILDTYVTFKNGEAFLTNMSISNFTQNSLYFDHDERRSRKLLMHKKEITKLEHTMKTKGLTCVLLKLYFKTNLVKAEICLVQGKKLFDKRQDEKDREIKRHLEREIKKW